MRQHFSSQRQQLNIHQDAQQGLHIHLQPLSRTVGLGVGNMAESLMRRDDFEEEDWLDREIPLEEEEFPEEEPFHPTGPVGSAM